MKRALFSSLILALSLGAAAHGETPPVALEAKQLLESRCLFCHGEDPEGGLRVDSRAALLAGGSSGPALVPGEPDRSLLVSLVRRTDAKRAMPPKHPLSDEEIALLTTWVAAGAPWPDAEPAPPPVAEAPVEKARPRALRRLTSDEYLATVQALLGAPVKLPFPLPRDATGGSGFVTADVVSLVEAGRFLAAAEALGASALPRLRILLPCAPELDGEDACARAFITEFGRRAFRRPLTADERARLYRRYRHARRALRHGFDDGLRLVIQAMLVAPQFLYHGLDAAPGDQHALASRLSYFLTGGPPDDALAGAADAGELGSGAQIAAHARRLLHGGRAAGQIAAFHRQWLHLDGILDLQKDGKVFKDWNPKLQLSMEKETQRFIHHVFFEGDGKLETLLLAPFSFVDERLAKLYGVPGVKGPELRRVELDPAQRAGVLTHAAFLASQALPGSTSPVKRGKTIMQDVLCLPPPPPPPGIDFEPPKPDPRAQTRELYAAHVENRACRTCHERMDPAGFAFESYDAIGRHRTHEAGRPVDTSGVLVGLATGPQPFTGARPLLETIARSDETRRCVAKKWLRFALGRMETPDEAPSVDQVHGAFAASGWDLRALVVAVTTSDAFLRAR